MPQYKNPCPGPKKSILVDPSLMIITIYMHSVFSVFYGHAIAPGS